MSVEVRAAGLVVFRRIINQIEYLMLQTSYGVHHWTPPKGHVEPGESDMDAALRETEEEAGLKRTDLKLIEGYKQDIKYMVKEKPKVVVYWLAEALNNAPVILSNEHQGFEWVALDRALELAGYEEMKNILKDCDSFLRENQIVN